MMPKVSVIIPTYNRAKLIGRAINSVLQQTFTDYEIVVVDDGSTDHTVEVLKEFEHKIRYYHQPNAGISGARNRGIAEARGEYIAFLDSDDAWLPDKLAVQVDILDRDRDIGIVYSKMLILNEQGKHCGFKPDERTGRDFLELVEIRGDIATSTVMTRRQCFDKVGTFDPDLPPMEDFDMWLRIAKFYKIFEVENVTLAYYYQHGQQATRDVKRVYEGLVKLETKILKIADDVPQNIKNKVIKRLTMHQYTLSRIYYKEGNLQVSFRNVASCISGNPSVGLTFCEPSDPPWTRLIKLIKPYGFLIVCWLKLNIKGSQP